jgi:hypothetical protein
MDKVQKNSLTLYRAIVRNHQTRKFITCKLHQVSSNQGRCDEWGMQHAACMEDMSFSRNIWREETTYNTYS